MPEGGVSPEIAGATGRAGTAPVADNDAFWAGRQDMDGAYAPFSGEPQLQEDGQRNAALMQSLMHAAAAGIGQPVLPMMQMGQATGMPGQPGLPLQQVSNHICL